MENRGRHGPEERYNHCASARPSRHAKDMDCDPNLQCVFALVSFMFLFFLCEVLAVFFFFGVCMALYKPRKNLQKLMARMYGAYRPRPVPRPGLPLPLPLTPLPPLPPPLPLLVLACAFPWPAACASFPIGSSPCRSSLARG